MSLVFSTSKLNIILHIAFNGDAPVSREVAFEPVEPKKPGRSSCSGRVATSSRANTRAVFFDELRAHATPVVVLVQDVSDRDAQSAVSF